MLNYRCTRESTEQAFVYREMGLKSLAEDATEEHLGQV